MGSENERQWLLQKGTFGSLTQGPSAITEFELQMRDPRSELYKKTFTSQLIQSLNIEGMQEQSIEMVQKAMKEAAEFQAQLASDSASRGLSTDQAFVQDVGLEQLRNAANDLNKAQNNLPSVVKQRDDFINSLPKQWENERERQFDTLLPSLNSALDKMGLSPLNDKEQGKLRGLHKAQELMLMKDSPIPPEASLAAAQEKESAVKNIELMRIIAAKQQGVDFENIEALKPSQVKALQQGEIGKLMKDHGNECRKADSQLMQQHLTTLKDYDSQISKVQNLQQQVQDVSTAVKNSQQQGTANVVDNLQQLYDLSKASGKTGASLESDFEFKVTSMIKKMTPEERDGFQQQCEDRMSKMAGNDSQRHLIEKALTVNEEVPKLSMSKPK